MKDANDVLKSAGSDGLVALIKAATPAIIESEHLVDQPPNPVLDSFRDSILTASQFRQLRIEERKTILSPFLKEADYGIIFAPRGVGKSWISLLVAKALCEGTDLGDHWQATEQKRTLYIDSEMNLFDVQQRCEALQIEGDQFNILSHERLYSTSDDQVSFNLADPSQQDAITEVAMEQSIDVLIIDNLSTGFLGLRENESDSWERVSPWLLDLRRRGIGVILVCHAGRNGQIRGTSKREDATHWILSAEDSDEVPEPNVLSFKTKFTKCRNAQPSDACALAWRIDFTAEGPLVTTRTIDKYSQFVELVLGGMTSAKDLAEELEISKGTASKWAKRACEDKHIRNENGKYLPPK